jgi:hypothetical protein
LRERRFEDLLRPLGFAPSAWLGARLRHIGHQGGSRASAEKSTEV